MLVLALLLNLAALTPLDGAGYTQLLEEHRGEPVLVNIWATWCIPCREEFPDLVRLHREQGLKVISISIDSPDDSARAQQFLEEYRAEFPAYIQAEKDFSHFQRAVDPSWPGAIPATFLFDRSGSPVFKRVGLVTYEELVEQLDRLDKP